MTMDTAALTRQLAELDKVATPGPWEAERRSFGYPDYEDGPIIKLRDIRTASGLPIFAGSVNRDNEGNIDLTLALHNNLPAILRALCVMAAVGKLDFDHWNVRDWINARADELLAECTGAK